MEQSFCHFFQHRKDFWRICFGRMEFRSEDYAKSTGFHNIVWTIWENFIRRGWMEGLAVPETAGNVLNHHQACFCEGSMLRQFAQLRLSSEIGRFECHDSSKIKQTLVLARVSLTKTIRETLGKTRVCMILGVPRW